MHDEYTYLFSSFLDVPERFFHGYCFAGPDLIVGEAGHAAYVAARGEPVGFFEDGAYVSLSRSGDAISLGADFKGYKKIFYYSRGEVWAVSNSIPQMVRHLRAHGVMLRADPAQVESWTVPSTLTRQMTSFATAVEGVRLLPSACHLEIAGGELHVRARAPAPRLDYEEALRIYLERWVGRTATLLMDEETTVSADLTGGRDSRTVLSFYLAARQYFGAGLRRPLHLRSGTQERVAADLAVAKRLAQTYRLDLNLAPARQPTEPTSNAQAYRGWHDLCSGVYGPIYLPSRQASSTFVSLGGGGGESHRPFYKVPSLDALLERQRRHFVHPDRFEPFAEEVRAAMATLEAVEGEGVDPLIRHYREFSDRMHAGREPQYAVKVLPLAGKDLYACAAACEPQLLQADQILYDIMQSLAPGLMIHPYENDGRQPSETNLARLAGPLALEPQAGSVFRGAERAARPEDPFAGGTAFQMLEESLVRAAPSIPDDLLSARYVSEAIEAVRAAQREGKLAHASLGRATHICLLAAMLSDG